MSTKQEVLKNLPAVNKLLSSQAVELLLSRFGKEMVMYAIHHSLSYFREQIKKGSPLPSDKEIFEKIQITTLLFSSRSLKKVFNATGVVIHTNLGRSPFSKDLLNDSYKVLNGYNNLEFDLENGSRGNRNEHAAGLLKFLTGAEDVLVLNNAAAALMLILRTFAKGKEVIVSRGELIEIGGSFRIPDIMAASDCKMVEVGTTNKTKLKDYEQAITKRTSLLFKAHKSNYIIKGFTEEVELKELSKLGKTHNIPVLFDLGSGLLKKSAHPFFENEPIVSETIEKGVDMVCFSGDKLLGGPQAGIIAGKKIHIDRLKKEPMLRALRVCKTTLALLETACTYFLDDKLLKEKNLIYKIINRNPKEIKDTAEKLKKYLTDSGIAAAVVSSSGQCGGGTLPDREIESYAVVIKNNEVNKLRSEYAESMYRNLLLNENPVLGVLKKGNIYFDVLTIFNNDIENIAKVICEVHHSIENSKK